MAKIYISSTYRDLVQCREAVARALRRMNHAVVAMEEYVASDQRPLDRCLADVADSDVYVGIFGWRYGFVPEDDNPRRKSITELEYRQAVASRKPTLLFLLREDAPWVPGDMDQVTGEGEGGRRIRELRGELSLTRMVSFFSTADELATLASNAVANWERDSRPQIQLDPALTWQVASGPQPREVSHDLLLAYCPVDEAHARRLAEQLEPRGRSTALAPRALFAADALDFHDLERSARQAQIAAVLISDEGAQQLAAAPEQARRALHTLQARTGGLLALVRGPRAAGLAGDWGLHPTLDLSGWADDVGPPIELLLALDGLISRHRTGEGARSVVGLPFTVVAMRADEAEAMAARPEMIADELGAAALRQFNELCQALEAFGAPPFTTRYGSTRELWHPFFGNERAIGDLIGEVVGYLNRTQKPQLRNRAIKVQLYPFDPLVEQVRPLGPIYRELAQTGCVVLLDEFSLFHPAVRKAFQSSPLSNSDRVALVTISPFNLYGLPPRQLLETELSQRLAAAFDRFTLEYDPRCELGICDENRLKRWLRSSLPLTLQALRELQPNAEALDRFAAEMGRERTLEGASLMYSEGGVL